MKAAPISPLSIAPSYIELMYDEEVLAVGTAFYVRHSNQLFLVSNWHNFSGRNPTTKKPLSKYAAILDRVRVHAHTSESLGDTNVVTYKLSNEDVNLWYEHPKFGSRVDVAILPVTDDRSDCRYDIHDALNRIDPHEKWHIWVSENVFILGYPFGISAGNRFPIWKSASLASEPKIDIDGKPLIYVDTASRPGMSGSPVVRHSRRAVALTQSKPNSPVYRFHAELIGIYSGRVVAKDELDAQLGMVWKASCINEIISGEKVAEC